MPTEDVPGNTENGLQKRVNSRVYSSPRLVRQYAHHKLRPAEAAFVSRHESSIRGRRVLELGCGAGRITRHLLELTDDVVGLDVSPAMVAHCQRTLPSGMFAVGDMRDLSAYADASFDLVVGGANVLDAVSHEDREAVLAEARRVLSSEGLFYFSSHNRNSRQALTEAREGPQLRFSPNPFRQLRAVQRYVVGRVNHPRLASHQRFEDDYAIINDDAHGWRLLHYYVDRHAQGRQLASVGFELLEVTDVDGRLLAADADDTASTELHYVAQARGG